MSNEQGLPANSVPPTDSKGEGQGSTPPTPAATPPQPQQDQEFSHEFKPGWVPSQRLGEVSRKYQEAKARVNELESALRVLQAQAAATPAQPKTSREITSTQPLSDIISKLGLEPGIPENENVAKIVQEMLAEARRTETLTQPAATPEIAKEISALKQELAAIKNEREAAAFSFGLKQISDQTVNALNLGNHVFKDEIFLQASKELADYLVKMPPETPLPVKLNEAGRILNDRFKFWKGVYDQKLVALKGGDKPKGGIGAQLPGAAAPATEIDPLRQQLDQGQISIREFMTRRRESLKEKVSGG